MLHGAACLSVLFTLWLSMTRLLPVCVVYALAVHEASTVCVVYTLTVHGVTTACLCVREVATPVLLRPLALLVSLRRGL